MLSPARPSPRSIMPFIRYIFAPMVATKRSLSTSSGCDGYMAVTWRLRGGYMAVTSLSTSSGCDGARQRMDDAKSGAAVTRRLHGGYTAVTRRLHGGCTAVTQRLHGTCDGARPRMDDAKRGALYDTIDEKKDWTCGSSWGANLWRLHVAVTHGGYMARAGARTCGDYMAVT